MLTIYSESDDGVCRQLWEKVIPVTQLTDLWDVRACFHQYYNRKLSFIVAKEEESEEIIGLIPLCYIDEHKYYGYFPGEVWQEKTWLEQNQIFVRDAAVLNQMIQWIEKNLSQYFLRYLNENIAFPEGLAQEDEIGYLFYPRAFNNSIDEYYSVFSKKSIKSIRREVAKMYDRDLCIDENFPNAFEEMVAMNIERFGSSSYFASNRFVKSFRALKELLEKRNMLKMTTVLIEGKIAAIDMGCLFNEDYTLLAGGTSESFPGVAKVINLHHIQEACKNNYKTVDFLCGNFSWKTMFHLTPRPLFKMTSLKEQNDSLPVDISVRNVVV